MDIYLKKAIEMFPDAKCELNYNSPFEFLIAVVLSAQTTDAKVNKVTPNIFAKYHDQYELAKADFNDLFMIIKPLGLAKGKTNNVIKLSKELVEFGVIPNKLVDLLKLSGVGIKTASVFLSEIYKEPHIAVDTHVYRISKRLGLILDSDDVKECQKKLESRYDKSEWIKVHHTFLFLGRYRCKAKKPECSECLLKKVCFFYNNN